ncbi:sulfurtransferase [Agromyces sp. ISL-38]|uniref:sulfurtransferase n=1 Tax=Agromyces sp. ISL-38 TaxID=2819107 RepID=UPI001BE79B68|nr:rhodanese-like domain-containing protein [Agromyces sp. ISL-38]MBT2498756.1 sulfurtransferase [Agromyces sp. ISL-38]MBT2516556.1 sulfurtransferase [Streptomyces sp. ISL-90]
MTALELGSALVSPHWLADHLGHPALVVVDATVLGVETDAGFRWLSGLDEYLIQGHVPGAVFADLLEEFSDPAAGLTFAKPDVAQLEAAARGAGIDDDVTVVIYDSAIGQWAARLWWLLRSTGVERVAVLDGGLAGWRAEGHPVEGGYQQPRAAGRLTLDERPERWADKAEVEQVVAGESDAALICALPASEFRGETGRRARRGHIPRSVSVPVSTLVDRESREFLRGEALGERLRGVDTAASDGARTIVYCGAGIAAAGAALALHLAGHEDVAIYDGSLEEWAADDDAPLVTLAG